MSQITQSQVDWLLYNLPALRAAVDAMEPPVSRSIVLMNGSQGTREDGGVVQQIAVRRASISIVLDAVERGLRSLHPEDRRIYRMKYRNYMRRKQMSKMTYLSASTLSRRLERIRTAIALHVGQLPEDILTHFWGQIETVLAS